MAEEEGLDVAGLVFDAICEDCLGAEEADLPADPSIEVGGGFWVFCAFKPCVAFCATAFEAGG